MSNFFARFVLPYNKFWAAAITAFLMWVSAKANFTLGIDENDVLAAIGVLGSILVQRIPNVKPAE